MGSIFEAADLETWGWQVNSKDSNMSGAGASCRRLIISTSKAPAAIGPYNQAVQVDNTLYVSGQIGFLPETMQIVSGGAVAEARQALKNMGEILRAAKRTR